MKFKRHYYLQTHKEKSSNAIPINILVKIFVDTDKFMLKFIWKEKGPIITKTIFKNRIK